MLSAPDNNGTLVQFQKVIFKTYQKIGSTSECNIIRLDYQPLFRKGACASPLPYYVPPLLREHRTWIILQKELLPCVGTLDSHLTFSLQCTLFPNFMSSFTTVLAVQSTLRSSGIAPRKTGRSGSRLQGSHAG